MPEVVLVDPEDRPLGIADRIDAHVDGRLHRAVSVFLFNKTGQTLIQRRAPHKALFPGRWANSCCTHPYPGETPVEAGERRLSEELGLATSLRGIGSFVYRARDSASGLVEHELDHVLVGEVTGAPTLNPLEVDALAWVDLDELRRNANDGTYAPWVAEALRHFPDLDSTS